MKDEKLQKLIAHAGLGSRRTIEKWIDAGRVSVNGKCAKLGDRATRKDAIKVDGKPLVLQATWQQPAKALIYHKPEGEISSRHDPAGRPTIFDRLPALPQGRWVAVGRLDINTSGLILFTNSGDLANSLMHPSAELEREYRVRVRGQIDAATIIKLTKQGVMLDGKRARFERCEAMDANKQGSNRWYRVVIKEGRYREVRRLWAAVGAEVSRLKRVRYGTVKLSRELTQGHYMKMAPRQLEKLIAVAGLEDKFGRSKNHR